MDATGRAVEEQLAELTRLVLRLPEVDALLQRAGLQPPAGRLEPNAALELFIKVAALCMEPRSAPLYGHGVTGEGCVGIILLFYFLFYLLWLFVNISFLYFYLFNCVSFFIHSFINLTGTVHNYYITVNMPDLAKETHFI